MPSTGLSEGTTLPFWVQLACHVSDITQHCQDKTSVTMTHLSNSFNSIVLFEGMHAWIREQSNSCTLKRTTWLWALYKAV